MSAHLEHRKLPAWIPMRATVDILPYLHASLNVVRAEIWGRRELELVRRFLFRLLLAGISVQRSWQKHVHMTQKLTRRVPRQPKYVIQTVPTEAGR